MMMSDGGDGDYVTVKNSGWIHPLYKTIRESFAPSGATHVMPFCFINAALETK